VEINRRDFFKFSLGTAGLLFLNPPQQVSAAEHAGPDAWGVLVDTAKCQGCWWCYAACKVNHGLPETLKPDPDNPPRLSADTWTTLCTVQETEDVWLYAKRQCMHCADPACVEACIVGALQKTPEGPVVYDDRKCIGCRYCMVACPFGVPSFDWEETVPWISKCNFCAERLAEGLQPSCVEACPHGALTFGKREDLLVEARRRIDAEPGRYIDHIYGEEEAGGTSWLYISPAPLEELGFPAVAPKTVTTNVSRAVGLVPPVLLGVTTTMTGIYWLTKRKQKLAGTAEETKREAKKK
jgi:formate dehydrogenase iron-sulfur subunit